MEPDYKSSKQHHRQLSDAMRKVVSKKVLRLLHVGIIYPMQDRDLVMLVQVVPKKGAITSEERAYLRGKSTRMCINYWVLNKATQIDHFSLFIGDMLEMDVQSIILPLPRQIL